jgi:hypothetical protein
MKHEICPDCGFGDAEITGVATGEELLAAAVERSLDEGMSFEPELEAGEALVYTLTCSDCNWMAIRSTERLTFMEDPEPIG